MKNSRALCFGIFCFMKNNRSNSPFNLNFQDIPEKEIRKDAIGWDVENWKRAIDCWSTLDFAEPKKILVIGEREGGLSLLIALNGYQCICSDARPLGELPLTLHVKHKVEPLIEYQHLDMTEIPYPDEAFDMVVFKSVVGALQKKETINKGFSEIHRVLRKGGAVVFADNLRASRLHQWARKRFTKWGENWYYPSIEEFDGFTSQFSSKNVRVLGLLVSFGRNEKQREIIGRMDKLFEKMVPRLWRYIYSCVAKK